MPAQAPSRGGRPRPQGLGAGSRAGLQPRVDPLRIARRDEGTIAVEVHQVVHDLKGELLLDETVRHVFRFADGLVTRFDIEDAGGLSAIAHR